MRDDRETGNERVEPSRSGLRDSLREMSPAFDSANAAVETELEAIAVRVRHWRDGSNLTLQELARRSGVAASTIQKTAPGPPIPRAMSSEIAPVDMAGTSLAWTSLPRRMIAPFP